MAGFLSPPLKRKQDADDDSDQDEDSIQDFPTNVCLLIKYVLLILKKRDGIKELLRQLFKNRKGDTVTSTYTVGAKKGKKPKLKLLVDMFSYEAAPTSWDMACKALKFLIEVRCDFAGFRFSIV